MKTLNIRSITRVGFTVVMYGAFLLFLGAFTVGCGSDSKSGNNNPGFFPGSVPGCPTCNQTNVLYSAVGQDQQGNSMEIDIYMNGAGVQQQQLYSQNGYWGSYPDPYNSGFYSGGVTATGVLQLATGAGFNNSFNGGFNSFNGFGGGCSLPPGSYSLNEFQPTGQIDGSGIVSGIAFSVSGTAIVLYQNYSTFVNQSPAVVGPTGRHLSTAMIGQWSMYINNQYCGSLGFY